VYYEEAGITFVYDQADRRDVARCPLTLSPQWAWLASQVKTPTLMDQRAFVRALRITLYGCLDSPKLLDLARQVKFTSAGAMTGQVQQGKESIDRRLLAALTGSEAFPEEISVSVPVFENFNNPQRMMCAVELMVQEQRFALTPYPMQMRAAMDQTLDTLGDLLETTGVPVFEGRP
jgi:hypothetical protein